MSALTLRISGPGDGDALRRLAERDSARPLDGRALVAEVCGEPRAAICLETRRVVADPFEPTAAIIDLLRARADQLAQPSRTSIGRGSGIRRRVAALLPRPARQPAP
jgi:hypothetical protein